MTTPSEPANTPDRQRAAAAFIDSLQRESERISSVVEGAGSLARLREDQLQAVAGVAAAFHQMSERIRETLASAIEALVTGWDRAMPDNWKGIAPSDVSDVVEGMVSLGIGLAWVPRRELIETLAQERDRERWITVLIEQEEHVIEDLYAALNQVEQEDLQVLARAGRSAVGAYASGHHWAAQALAAATLTTVIHLQLDISLARLRLDFAEVDPLEHHLGSIRIVATLVAVARVALSQYEHPSIPARFNRHASLHSVSVEQYSQTNALAALLLLVSLLRELESQPGDPDDG